MPAGTRTPGDDEDLDPVALQELPKRPHVEQVTEPWQRVAEDDVDVGESDAGGCAHAVRRLLQRGHSGFTRHDGRAPRHGDVEEPQEFAAPVASETARSILRLVLRDFFGPIGPAGWSFTTTPSTR